VTAAVLAASDCDAIWGQEEAAAETDFVRRLPCGEDANWKDR